MPVDDRTGRGPMASVARATLSVVLTTAVTWATAAPASAHAIELVGKQDLPIPRWLFGWAAAVVLVISFVALGTLWTTPRLSPLRERTVARLPGLLDPVCGALGVAAFAGLVYAGFAGTQDAADNILPTWIFVVFWVGIPVVSLALGDVFRAFNPWRALGRTAGWIAQTWQVARGRSAMPEPLTYSARLGHWPAALGIAAFVFVELAYPGRNDPSTLATLVVVYAVVQLVGMSLFGVRAWSDRADGLGVYFGLFATLAPLRWSRDALRVRAPLSGTAAMGAGAGTVGLLCVMIGSTSFDGFTVSTTWNAIAGWLQPSYRSAGLDALTAGQLASSTGLIGVVLVIAGLYRLGIAGMRRAGDATPSGVLARQFVPALIPIALAYVISHYFGVLSYQGQAVASLASDPLGSGADLLGTASATIDYNWISATTIWYVQVAALIAGHAAGLAIAHERALVLYDDPRKATRSQYWMLGVMVAFTTRALFLLSAAA